MLINVAARIHMYITVWESCSPFSLAGVFYLVRNTSSLKAIFFKIQIFYLCSSELAGFASIAVTSLAWSAYLDSLFGNQIINSTINVHWDLGEPFSSRVDVPALVLITLLFVIASVGIRFISFFNNFLAVLNLFLLTFIIVTGLIFGSVKNLTSTTYANGVDGVLHGSTLVLYSYLGFETSTAAIAEAKNPRKNVPISMIISLSIICMLYSLTSLSLNLVVPFDQIDTAAPFPIAFKHLGNFA